MENGPRIDEELLEYDDDVRLYEETPFTGVGYERYRDGTLRNETPYVNGFPHGVCREWYPNGQLECEYECKNGRSHGKKTYWYPNGTVKSVSHYELGIQLDHKEWNEKGEVTLERRLDPDDPNSLYPLLLKFREDEAKNGQ